MVSSAPDRFPALACFKDAVASEKRSHSLAPCSITFARRANLVEYGSKCL
jgi:hypothetical protein